MLTNAELDKLVDQIKNLLVERAPWTVLIKLSKDNQEWLTKTLIDLLVMHFVIYNYWESLDGIH